MQDYLWSFKVLEFRNVGVEHDQFEEDYNSLEEVIQIGTYMVQLLKLHC